MTEREFLERFINFIYYTENKSNWVLAIDNFLEAVHSEYEEVEFKRKPFDKIAKEQIHKMQPELRILLNKSK